ncbi:exodeoxyribonuclease VII small subunit [Litchfieldella xinjiangensis]|uniref:exodeoxyribonuclease VII small subunit n=1 Tax=Litchfieldella xinjiangensis TaxID=1166948 RepID=UPI0006947DED|nr:exodeoxyribonuclease VII small subunit [Halomonas xinjiangensis]
MADKELPSSEREAPQDFATTLERLETLVQRLEAGDLSLEDSLAAFEQGVTLTRDAQRRLDAAELKVRALVDQPDDTLRERPFSASETGGGGER